MQLQRLVNVLDPAIKLVTTDLGVPKSFGMTLKQIAFL